VQPVRGLFLGLSACLLLASARPEAAHAAGDTLALPDKVVLKEGAPLPYFTVTREIECLVISDDAEKVVINTSRKQGVEERHEIPARDVDKVVRGDPSTRAFDLIRPRLALPADSLNEEFYAVMVAGTFKPFLAEYPQSSHKAEVEEAVQAFEREGEQVHAGKVRIGERWYEALAYERDKPDIMAARCLDRLNAAAAQRRPDQFLALLPEIAQHKASRFYPDLVESAAKALPDMKEKILSVDAASSTQQEITYLESEIERLNAMVSLAVNQEPPSQQNNWQHDPALVYVDSAKAWYDRKQVSNSEFSEYFTDTARPRLKLDAATKGKVQGYIEEIGKTAAAVAKLRKSLTEPNEDAQARMALLEQYERSFKSVDVALLRRTQADLDLMEQALLNADPGTPSWDDYEKAAEAAGRKPEDAARRLKALPGNMADAAEDPNLRKELLARIQQQSAAAYPAVAGERARLQKIGEAWPANNVFVRLSLGYDAMLPLLPLASAKAYEKIAAYPAEPGNVADRWIGARKAEAAMVLDLVFMDVSEASNAIREGDSWRASELIGRIKSVTPSNPALLDLSRQANARLDQYLAEGNPGDALRFLPVMREAWKGNGDLAEAESKFRWIHLWGYSAAIGKPRFIITAVIYFFVGIALTGILTGWVLKFLRKFRR
jgi:hypothetical protein